MNSPSQPNPREQMEVRIVAFLLGEASPFETAEIQQAIAQDPALAAFHDEMRRTIGLVTEASERFSTEAEPAAEPAKLSPERREKLLQTFKVIAPPELAQPRVRHFRWDYALRIAAVVAVLGVVVAVIVPSFVKVRESFMLMQSVGADNEALSEVQKEARSRPMLAFKSASPPPPSTAPAAAVTPPPPALASAADAGIVNYTLRVADSAPRPARQTVFLPGQLADSNGDGLKSVELFGDGDAPVAGQSSLGLARHGEATPAVNAGTFVVNGTGNVALGYRWGEKPTTRPAQPVGTDATVRGKALAHFYDDAFGGRTSDDKQLEAQSARRPEVTTSPAGGSAPQSLESVLRGVTTMGGTKRVVAPDAGYTLAMIPPARAASKASGDSVVTSPPIAQPAAPPPAAQPPPQKPAPSAPVISGYVDTSANWKLGSGAISAAKPASASEKVDGFNLNVANLEINKRLDVDSDDHVVIRNKSGLAPLPLKLPAPSFKGTPDDLPKSAVSARDKDDAKLGDKVQVTMMSGRAVTETLLAGTAKQPAPQTWGYGLQPSAPVPTEESRWQSEMAGKNIAREGEAKPARAGEPKFDIVIPNATRSAGYASANISGAGGAGTGGGGQGGASGVGSIGGRGYAVQGGGGRAGVADLYAAVVDPSGRSKPSADAAGLVKEEGALYGNGRLAEAKQKVNEAARPDAQNRAAAYSGELAKARENLQVAGMPGVESKRMLLADNEWADQSARDQLSRASAKPDASAPTDRTVADSPARPAGQTDSLFGSRSDARGSRLELADYDGREDRSKMQAGDGLLRKPAESTVPTLGDLPVLGKLFKKAEPQAAVASPAAAEPALRENMEGERKQKQSQVLAGFDVSGPGDANGIVTAEGITADGKTLIAGAATRIEDRNTSYRTIGGGDRNLIRSDSGTVAQGLSQASTWEVKQNAQPAKDYLALGNISSSQRRGQGKAGASDASEFHAVEFDTLAKLEKGGESTRQRGREANAWYAKSADKELAEVRQRLSDEQTASKEGESEARGAFAKRLENRFAAGKPSSGSVSVGDATPAWNLKGAELKMTRAENKPVAVENLGEAVALGVQVVTNAIVTTHHLDGAVASFAVENKGASEEAQKLGRLHSERPADSTRASQFPALQLTSRTAAPAKPASALSRGEAAQPSETPALLDALHDVGGATGGVAKRELAQIVLPTGEAEVADGDRSETELRSLASQDRAKYRSRLLLDEDAKARKLQLAANPVAEQVRIGLPAVQAPTAPEPAAVAATDAPAKKPATPPATPQPEILTRENNFSTFSLNVSDVSFKLAAASLQNGVIPDPGSIRVEEFVNAFHYRDPAPALGARIGFAWERARYPFAHNRDILRLGVQTAARGREAQKPLNLVIALDNSGSMERPDRVAILREALKVLAVQLRPQDRISVIAFSRTARLWVDGMAGGNPQAFLGKVLDLNPEGGTNLEDAMNLAYATATKHFMAQGVNRVILLTDGAANLGNVEPEELKKQVVAQRQRGIALDCFGIGWEGYDDDFLEILSRNGDGRYGFLNSPEEAAPEFADQLAGALNVSASDVKTQVEFNPQRVTSWRQIGYAKHQLKKEQFRDNTVDAAEIAAAEQGNALYVIETNPNGTGPIGVVRVRFKVPETGEYVEQEWPLAYVPRVPALDQSSPAMRLAVTASAFGEWLSTSPFAAEVKLPALQAILAGVPQILAPDPRPQQLATMLQQARSAAGK